MILPPHFFVAEITAANKSNVCTYAVTKDELDQPVSICKTIKTCPVDFMYVFKFQVIPFISADRMTDKNLTYLNYVANQFNKSCIKYILNRGLSKSPVD